MLRYFYHQRPLDDSDWHQMSYSVCVHQNLKTQWPHDLWSPSPFYHVKFSRASLMVRILEVRNRKGAESGPVEFGKMNCIDLRPLKLKFPYIRMNCVCWWPLRLIVHSDVTGKVTEGFQLLICSHIPLSIKIPAVETSVSSYWDNFLANDCTTFI